MRVVTAQSIRSPDACPVMYVRSEAALLSRACTVSLIVQASRYLHFRLIICPTHRIDDPYPDFRNTSL